MVKLRDLAHDGQSESAALNAGAFDAVEAIEDFARIIGGNPDSVVLDLQHHLAVPLVAQDDPGGRGDLALRDDAGGHLVGAPTVFDFLGVGALFALRPCEPATCSRRSTPWPPLENLSKRDLVDSVTVFRGEEAPFFIYKQNVGGAALAGGACSPVGVESGKTPSGRFERGGVQLPLPRGEKRA